MLKTDKSKKTKTLNKILVNIKDLRNNISERMLHLNHNQLLQTTMGTLTCWRRRCRAGRGYTRTWRGHRGLNRTWLQLDNIATQFAISCCAPEMISGKDVSKTPGILRASYYNSAKIFRRPWPTSLLDCFEIVPKPSAVSLDTDFRDSLNSVWSTFRLERTSSQFHRKSAHPSLAPGNSLLLATMLSSKDFSRCFINTADSVSTAYSLENTSFSSIIIPHILH